MIRHVTYFGEKTIDAIIDLSNETIDQMIDDCDDWWDWSHRAENNHQLMVDHRLALDFFGCLDSRL